MLWRPATCSAYPAPTRSPNPPVRLEVVPLSIRMLDSPPPPRTKNPFSAGNQVTAAKSWLICRCAILPVCATADPRNTTRRLRLKATPPLTMFKAMSGLLSVAFCKPSSNVIDRPFTLYFAPNPGPKPVPTYQWDHRLSDQSGSAALATPAIAQDKPATAAMRHDKFMISPRIHRRLLATDRSRLSVIRILHPVSRLVKPDLDAG